MGLDMMLVKRNDVEVGYWRKANAIHKWFVDNVQSGDDDCGDYMVSREDLELLLDACSKVLENHDLAEKLLPTQEGFFFGSTEYDDWYFENLEYTKRLLERILEEDDCSGLYYYSSW